MSARPSPWLLGPVLTALVLFGLAHRESGFAGLCALLIIGAYGHRRTLPWPTRWRWPLGVGLGLAAWGLSWLYYATVLQGGQGLVYFPRLYYKPVFITTSGMLLALAMVWLWHLPHVTAHTSGGILMGAIALVIVSGNFVMLPSSYGYGLGLFLVTTLSSLLALGGTRGSGSQRSGLLPGWPAFYLLACALLVGAGTWAISATLPALQVRISTALIEMLQGDSAQSGLGAGDRLRIERHRRVVLPQALVLTLSGSTPPGYLRTQVMSQYRNGVWKTDAVLTPTASPGSALPGLVTLPSDDTPGPQESWSALPPSPPLEQRAVTLLAELRGGVPLPYTARRLTMPASVACTLTSGTILHCTPAERLWHYRVTSQPLAGRASYRLAAGAAASAEVELAREAPEAVLAPLRPLAQQLAGAQTAVPLAAAQQLQEYFRRYYTYALQVDLADRGDPIVDFVLHRRPAYCEYYAAGLALMLRALGLAARVVGGYAVHEYNPLAGQWIVRQRDAHAWTEVFDPSSNAWVAFDATPLAVTLAQPAAAESTLLAQSWVWLTLQAQRGLLWVYTADPQRWLEALGALVLAMLWHPLSWLLLGGGLLLGLGLRPRRWLWLLRSWWQWRRAAKTSASPELDATVVEVQRLFAQVARALTDCGLPLRPAETLEEYLQRLSVAQTGSLTVRSPASQQALAGFARLYTVLRFYPAGVVAPELGWPPPAPDSLALLQRQAEQVLAALHAPC
ncbi:MAG: transglutaminaseTgpA domain-containing protein [Candidatus Tectimicrobiota bacterium]